MVSEACRKNIFAVLGKVREAQSHTDEKKCFPFVTSLLTTGDCSSFFPSKTQRASKISSSEARLDFRERPRRCPFLRGPGLHTGGPAPVKHYEVLRIPASSDADFPVYLDPQSRSQGNRSQIPAFSAGCLPANLSRSHSAAHIGIGKRGRQRSERSPPSEAGCAR